MWNYQHALESGPIPVDLWRVSALEEDATEEVGCGRDLERLLLASDSFTGPARQVGAVGGEANLTLTP